jgi:hypothetical protein
LVKSVIKVSFDNNEQDIRHLNSLLLAKPKEVILTSIIARIDTNSPLGEH